MNRESFNDGLSAPKLHHHPRLMTKNLKPLIHIKHRPQALTPNPLIANVNKESSELAVLACIFNHRLGYQNDQ